MWFLFYSTQFYIAIRDHSGQRWATAVTVNAACIWTTILKFSKYGVGYWWSITNVSALRDSAPLSICTTILAPVSECQWIVLTVSFGCGNTRLPVDGLTVEQSLESDAMLALSSDSRESAELIIHWRFTNGLPLEPAADEWTNHDIYSNTASFHILAHSRQFLHQHNQ